jgi:hypothetical protein
MLSAAGQWMPFPLSAVDMVVRTNWSDLLEVLFAVLPVKVAMSIWGVHL